MNYYLKERSKIFLLKYLKCIKITIFIVISLKSGKKSTSKPKKSTKKHIKKQLVKKKHKKAHVLFKSTLYEHCIRLFLRHGLGTPIHMFEYRPVTM